jgi:DNA polymerase-3 subunit alpha
MKPDTELKYIGVITKITRKFDKGGNAMAFVEMEDYEGKVEVIFFKDAFQKSQEKLTLDTVLWVSGRVNTRNDMFKIQAKEVTLPEEIRSKQAKILEIHLPLFHLSDTVLKQIKRVVGRHKGRKNVRIIVEKPGVGEVAVQAGKGFHVSIDDELLTDLQENVEGEKVLTFAEK